MCVFHMCVFITAGPSTKLFTWGGGVCLCVCFLVFITACVFECTLSLVTSRLHDHVTE
jgi:uncharacterized membrane protein YhaH (DUF805 family)